ncbi:phage tail terminator-like protein [Providencia sp. 21OH12SH02B-Prov]|uniref:phage tail terminator-like protein n=1 Tax=Providencia sp. 21OH12SH02B-Prov TaxID=3015951 RepID=UPI0022B68874|nr:phage tail terminator-like protein [Providencia sp. 21OH12SH02B-Prov]WBA57884.1 phage tail terminator-like protein [Providencia sp. 21OH12SH02B-Prov]
MNQSTINAEIRKLVASIGKDLNLKIAWPNLYFDDINDPYLQLHIMPAETDNIGLSLDMPVYRGVIQINVVGKVGSGDDKISTIADDVKNRLENGLTLGAGIYINGEPSQFTPISDETNYTIPIRASYRCNAIR